ncbi:uncharacterized protein RAG0_00480 [Rhynchosporium agropyri]|uniref:Major facilitator superfamily (MFS) profile domain-containing protein n=1 Tax=Rhynchosporium agropyri TaxID=914238 RepID=A0A1E1JSZ7_9HELO|nr:uncharacterized protein RAG0_00480 [Rhynchosporium agropyri]
MAGLYGRLAKKTGKKTIMLISLTSYTLGGILFTVVCYYHEIFDVRWIWLTPFFDVIGGGYSIVTSFSYTFISESIDKKRLSAYYYKLSAAQMAAWFVALCISSILLRRHVYVQCILGAVILSLTIPLCCMLPSKKGPPSQETSESSALLSAAPTLAPLAIDDEDGPLIWTIMRSLRTNARHLVSLIHEIMSSSALIRTTMFTFFMITVGIAIKLVFVQWTSFTYGWILAEVHVITAFEMIITSIILLTLPTVSHNIIKPRLGGSVSDVDLFVAKISAGLHVVGILCLGFAPGKVSYIVAMTIYKLGIGLVDAVRSYATGLLETKEEVEQLYIGMGMVEMLGGMVATAAWSGLFSTVIGKGYLVSRLPFLASSVILVASCACIWLLGRFGLKKSKAVGDF